MAVLIGISGKKHSGKTSVANIIIRLTKRYNPNLYNKWNIISFADPVKQICAYIKHEQVDVYNTPDGKYEEVYPDVTRRKFMTTIATEVARQINPNIWIDHLDGRIFAKENAKRYLLSNTIIDDVRFKNEAEYVVANKGILIRLEGDPGHLNNTHNTEHSSETELDDYPFTYVLNTDNIGTPEFIREVYAILNKNKML